MYRFVVDVRDGVAILRLPTIVDDSRAVELAERLEVLESDESVGIVIDCGSVELITSKPISRLMQLASQPVARQKRVVLANVPSNVEGIFRLLRLCGLMDSYATVDQAVRSFRFPVD